MHLRFTVAKIALGEPGTPTALESAIASIIPEGIDWDEIGFTASIAIDEAGHVHADNAKAFLRREVGTATIAGKAKPAASTSTTATDKKVATLAGTNLTASQIRERGKQAGYDLGWTKTPRITAQSLLTKAGNPAPKACSDEVIATMFIATFPE